MRDHELSYRHHKWGWNCPAVDVDSVLCEYSGGVPRALIEYTYGKYGIEQGRDHDSANYRALSALARGCDIPFFECVYLKYPWLFRLTPVTEQAKVILPEPRTFNEMDFVKFQYWLRRMPMSQEIKDEIAKLPQDGPYYE